MSNPNPKVSIGLPVYNGEEFLAEAVDSILAQTYADLELVISDNASTDGTERICRDYTARDSRVHYYRSEDNLGASWNFNRVFELANGDYFKWAAHDDRCEPEYLERCVKVLDENPEIVLVYPRSKRITLDGQLLPSRKRYDLHEDAAVPWERFRFLVWVEHSCVSIFGLIRSNVLKKTPLIGSYLGSDRVLIAELSLHGPFREIQDELFIHRDHEARSVRAFSSDRARLAWFDPKAVKDKSYRYWRMFSEYIKAIGRSPLNLYSRSRCYFQMLRWIKRHRKDLTRDLDIFTRGNVIGESSKSDRKQASTDQLSRKQ